MGFGGILNIGCVLEKKELSNIIDNIKKCENIDYHEDYNYDDHENTEVINELLKKKNFSFLIYSTYSGGCHDEYCYLKYTGIKHSNNSKNRFSGNTHEKMDSNDFMSEYPKIQMKFKEFLKLLYNDEQKYNLEIFATFHDF